MTKWEYTHRTWRVESGEHSAVLMPKTTDGLNQLGEQGWEVINMRHDGLSIFVWLKRPLLAAQPEAQPPPAVLKDL